MKPSNKPSLSVAYLIAVTLVDFMGLGIVVTLFPKLLLNPSAGLLPFAWTSVDRLTALGIFLAIYPLGQFIGAAILGKLSDYYGRRNLLLITLLGTLIGFIASGIALEIQSAVLLFTSRLFAGLFAGNVAIVQAGLIDLSPNEKSKNRNFSLLQVALGGSWVLGPPMGGWLSSSSIVSWFSYTTPFWVIAGLLLILLALTQFWFKETLLEPKKEKVYLLAGIKQVHQAFTLEKLRIAFIAWFIFVSGWWLFEAFLPTYLQQRFNFSPARIGDFLASMGGTYVLFQLLVVQRFTKLKPANMVKGTLVLSGVSVLGLAFVNSILALHIMITIFVCAQGFALPGLIISIANLADAKNQGQIMGMISSIQAIATVAMMMIGGWLDSFGLDVTVIGGGVLLILSWLIYCLHFRTKQAPAAEFITIE